MVTMSDSQIKVEPAKVINFNFDLTTEDKAVETAVEAVTAVMAIVTDLFIVCSLSKDDNSSVTRICNKYFDIDKK